MKVNLRRRKFYGFVSLSLILGICLFKVSFLQAADSTIETQNRLDEFLVSRTTQKFSGSPVTINVRDVDIKDVIRLISDASGFNVILGDDVSGKLTLSLVEVPWDQALDVILRTGQLGAERHESILRVITLKTLADEKQREFDLRKAEQLSARRVTRVFPISYADISEIQSVLKSYISAQGSRSSTGAAVESSALVQADVRTNSIIIYDLPENVDKMKKLIDILDSQTPQVLIEAKIIEASESFEKKLSGSLGLATGLENLSMQSALSSNGGNVGDALLGGIFKTGSDAANITQGKGLFGVSPKFNVFGGARLNALLQMGESEDEVKVVASPKTVVLHKQKATIQEGTPVLLPGATTIVGGGSVNQPITGSADIKLEVTPTVTNDGNVLLNVNVSKDVPQNFAGSNQTGIAKRNMQTQVIVESGSTLVIGGMYNLDQRSNNSGFPFLRKIPILGVLFGSELESVSRREIFFFITPRILNPKDSGINQSST